MTITWTVEVLFVNKHQRLVFQELINIKLHGI